MSNLAVSLCDLKTHPIWLVLLLLVAEFNVSIAKNLPLVNYMLKASAVSMYMGPVCLSILSLTSPVSVFFPYPSRKYDGGYLYRLQQQTIVIDFPL